MSESAHETSEHFEQTAEPGTATPELTFVQTAIAQEAQEAGIYIETVPLNRKFELGLIVGNVLASHTGLCIENFIPTAQAPKPTIKIPGNLTPHLKSVFQHTGADIVTHDKVQRRLARQYQFSLVETARQYTDLYSEIRLATELEDAWFEQDMTAASETVSAVIAAYGLMVGPIEHAKEQHARERSAAVTKKTIEHLRYRD